MKKSFRQMLSLLLTLALIFSLMVPAYAVEGDSSGAGDGTEITVPADGNTSGTEDGDVSGPADGGADSSASQDGNTAPVNEGDPSAAPAGDSDPDGEDDAAAALQALIDALPAPADIDPADEAQVKAVNDQIAAIYACAEENGLDVEDNETVNAVIAALYPIQTLEEPIANPVAKIGEMGYATLQEAINAVTDGTQTTITLQANITEHVTIAAGQNITLDLNDNTLTNTEGQHTITNNGTLTITGGGTVDNVSHAKAAIQNNEGANCTILSGTFTRSKENGQNSENNGGNSFYTINNYGTMTIGAENAANEITVTANGHYSSLVHNGWQNSGDAQNKTAQMTIYGGTFTGGLNTIKNDESGNLTITGGTFTNVTQYAVMNWNVANISGGTFVSNTMPAVYNGADTNTSTGQLTITGGTFTAPADRYVVYNDTSTDATTKITGGNYSSQYYTNQNSAPDYEPVDNGDGTYGVQAMHYVASVTDSEGNMTKYDDFAMAYSEAGEGATITLLADTDWMSTGTSSGKITITKSITIDLNGHTLTPKYKTSKDIEKGDYLDVQSGTLTIKDSSGNNSGVLTTIPTSSYVVRLYGGNLTLESGEISSADSNRTVYVYSNDSTFTMDGGSLINGKALAANSTTQCVLDVSRGTALINGGSIQATDTGAPVYAMKVGSSSAQLTVNGGTFSTGSGAPAIWKYGEGSITILGGDFDATTGFRNASTGGTVIIGSDQADSEKLTLPKLTLTATAVVTVHDNVTVETVEPASNTVTTFSAANKFGGQYGNDFTDCIKGNALYCEKIGDGDYYKVVPMTEDDSRIVAVVTHSDGTTSLFGDMGAAMTALQNGDRLTLKQDVANNGTTSWKSTASDVTIDLNGHNVTSNNANYGLWFYPVGKTVQTGDMVTITGAGTITGGKNAVYCSTNGSSGSYPVYTLNLGNAVELKKIQEGTGCCPIGLFSVQSRLQLNEGQDFETYASMTNAPVKTIIDGKTYIYNSLAQALKDQTSDGGTVTLLADCSYSSTLRVTGGYTTTLDLNGKTLTSSAQYGLIANGAGLVIENGTIEHTYTGSSYAVAVGMEKEGTDNSVLTLENVVINSTAKKETAVNINGTLKGVTVSLTGCTIKCEGEPSTTGVYFPVKDGVLNITDTTITAQNAVQVKGGTVTVKETESGKTVITSTGPHAEPGAETSGCTNTGDGIYVEDTYGYDPVVYVQSGTVKSMGAETSALLYFDNDQQNATGKIEVSGGSFSSKVPEDYCADGYVPTDMDTNGNYTVCNHANKEMTPAKDATCVDDGNIAYWHCPVCGRYFSDEACTIEITLAETVVQATGIHSYGTPEWTWSADCSVATVTLTCKNDPAHTASATATVTSQTTPATETKEGQTVYTATVTLEGQTYTATKTVTIPVVKPGHTHSYGTEWKFDASGHWHACACGDKSAVSAHTFQWVVDKEATSTEQGSKHEVCSVCGYRRASATIPATGTGDADHNQNSANSNTNTNQTDSKPSTTPKTGDSSFILICALGLVVASGGLAGIVLYNRKRKEE